VRLTGKGQVFKNHIASRNSAMLGKEQIWKIVLYVYVSSHWLKFS